MKLSKMIAPYVVLLAVTGILPALSGCASSRVHNTESLLSSAGFHTVNPSTPEQQNCYGSLPPNKLERLDKDGKAVYVYADQKTGLLYVGNEQDYQQFQQLALQQKIANEQMQAARMNQSAAMSWGAWGPGGMWW